MNQPTSQEIYRKVIIKTEDDLPKEDGIYIVHKKERQICDWAFSNSLKAIWLDYIDWYLIAQPSPDSQVREEEQEGQSKPTASIPDIAEWLISQGIGTGTNITVGSVPYLIQSFIAQWVEPNCKCSDKDCSCNTGRKTMQSSDEYYGLNNTEV